METRDESYPGRYSSKSRWPCFYHTKSEEDESNSWDFAHPSTGMIILAACIPVIGWAYLVYVLFNAIAEACCGKAEENYSKFNI